jgi:type III pantothenate kinase
MTPDVVADIGNSSLKWGRCRPDGVVDVHSVPLDNLSDLPAGRPLTWAVASVNPPARDRFAAHVRGRGDTVVVIDRPDLLPLVTRLPEPRRTGIDRLLAACAANALRPPGRPAAVVLVGTAVVVDFLDAAGVFLGGAIFPGPGLMARSLHEHTAQLPHLERIPHDPAVPGDATVPAIELGVHAAVVGGVNRLITLAADRAGVRATDLDVFVTGGAAGVLGDHVVGRVTRRPMLVLEGVGLAAEALP